MSALALLAVGMAAFVGTHLLMSHPLRAPLVARLGERGFLLLYSLVSFATLGLAVWARLRTQDADRLFWVAPPVAWDAATLVMLFASILLAGSLVGNPALPDPRNAARGDFGLPRGVFAITRHPMMWGIALWAIVHIALWGTAANLILCAGLLVLALAGAAGQDAKKRQIIGAAWRDWVARTAFVPFAGQVAGRVPWRAAWPGRPALLGGLILWAAATWAHAPLGGPVAGPWRWLTAG